MRYAKDTGEWNAGALLANGAGAQEDAVIRRDVLQLNSDQRAVRWWLIAALVALSVGGVAEFAKLRQGVAQEVTQIDSTLVSAGVNPFAGN